MSNGRSSNRSAQALQRTASRSLGSFSRVDEYTTIFIAGSLNERLIDGQTLEGKLYRCGRYQYGSVIGAQRTVARFATSVEKAVTLASE